MSRFSIVIPAYNPNEQDFQDCLNSIAEQSFSDYELIVVDDGSHDVGRIQRIVDASRIENVAKVVRTPNGGTYAARRRGISCASGDYVISVDSDDELIGEDALARISTALEDLGFPDYLLVSATRDRSFSTRLCDYSGLGVEGQGPVAIAPEAFNSLFIAENAFNSACCKVVKRNLFCEIKEPLPRIVMADDRYLAIDYLPHASSAGLLNTPLYFYRPSIGSTTRSAYTVDLYRQVDFVEQRVLGWVDSSRYDERAWAGGFLRLTSNHLCALCRNPSCSRADVMRACELLVTLPSLERALNFVDQLDPGSFEARQLSLLKSGAYARFVDVTRAYNVMNYFVGLTRAVRARLW